MKIISLAIVAALAIGTLAIPASEVVKGWSGKNLSGGQNWAVLVAGSNTWGNYRHQADIYHAYQILLTNGFPPSNIIMFHFDDIANNPSNPDKGIVINKPGGPNNYKNIPTDAYTGQNCTAANFLAAITGDTTKATGKVLKSTSNDNVFINYSDHGGTGIVAMPVGPYLYATDLNAALKTMQSKGMYKQLTFYLEACESGSMFQDALPTNINIYATTASSATESSYACYFDEHLETYVGDLYSVNWMENIDAVGTTKETLQQQFVIVQQETNLSHVQQYGQLSIAPEIIGEFFKFGGVVEAPMLLEPVRPMPRDPRSPRDDAVDSRDVKLEILRRKAAKSNSLEAVTALMEEEKSRLNFDNTIMSIASKVQGPSDMASLLSVRQPPSQWACYKAAIESFESKCRKFDDYGLKWTFVLSNLCNMGHSFASIDAAITGTCVVAGSAI